MTKGILLDMSGVLYTGQQALPGAFDALERIRKSGLPLRFITNTTRKTKIDIQNNLAKMGFRVNADEIFTAPVAAREYIRSHNLTPYLLIHPGLKPEFPESNQSKHDSVLVGDAEHMFDYYHLNKAFRILLEDAEFLAMGINRYFRDGEELSLDCGPFVKALEYASEKVPRVFGKPSREFFMSAITGMNCNPDEVIMIGDDVEADIIGALNCSLNAILVKTGKYCPGDEDRIKDKALCACDLAEAVEKIFS